MVQSFNFNIQLQATIDKLRKESEPLPLFTTTIRQKLHIENIVIRPGAEYSFHAVLYFATNICKLDKIIINQTKKKCKISNSTLIACATSSFDNFGINTFSFDIEYAKAIGNQLHEALNNIGKLRTIHKGLIRENDYSSIIQTH